MTWEKIEPIFVVVVNTAISICYGHIPGLAFISGWLICMMFGFFKKVETNQVEKEQVKSELYI